MRPENQEAEGLAQPAGNAPAVVRDPTWQRGRTATAAEVSAAADWYLAQGYDTRANVKGGWCGARVSDSASLKDYIHTIGIVGQATDAALALIALRTGEWAKGAAVGGGWKQDDLDRFHTAATRVGVAVRYAEGLAPSPAAVSAVDDERESKLTAMDDAKDGAELLALYRGGNSDNPQLRAFCFAHPEVGAELAQMLPLQLGVAARVARVARVEGQRLLDENPDAASVIERAREVGQEQAAKSDGPLKFIPGDGGM